jgi:hypothetical protein
MEKKKLDRIIDIIREQMVAGAGPTNNVAADPIAGPVEAG